VDGDLSLYGSSGGEPGGVKEGSGYGHLFPWGSHLEMWEMTYMPGLMFGSRFWDRCLST